MAYQQTQWQLAFILPALIKAELVCSWLYSQLQNYMNKGNRGDFNVAVLKKVRTKAVGKVSHHVTLLVTVTMAGFFPHSPCVSSEEHNFHPDTIPNPGAERNHHDTLLPLPRNPLFTVFIAACQVPWASCCPRPPCGAPVLQRAGTEVRACRHHRCACCRCTATSGRPTASLCCLFWAVPGLSTPWRALCALDSSFLSSTFHFPQHSSPGPRSFPTWQLVTWEMNRRPGEKDSRSVRCGR